MEGVWVVGWQNADIADTLHLRDVATATIFAFLYTGYTMAPSGEYDSAMRPCVRLLWPLVIIILTIIFVIIIIIKQMTAAWFAAISLAYT